jgi:hypothetical protein
MPDLWPKTPETSSLRNLATLKMQAMKNNKEKDSNFNASLKEIDGEEKGSQK